MADIRTIHSEKMTTGAAAVSGLLNGILVGAAMAGYLIGAASYLAMNAIYGTLFALIWRCSVD